MVGRASPVCLAVIEPTGVPQFDTGVDHANYVHTKGAGYRSTAQVGSLPTAAGRCRCHYRFIELILKDAPCIKSKIHDVC